MTRGKFIAFEGGEGAGKSTQARLLCEALESHGVTVVATREPGGTPGAEAIRELLLHPSGEGWCARSEALLFAAARSDHVERLIEPSLAAGKWVVCDRFVDSSRAYQGAAGALGDEQITTLHAIGSGGLLPDLTVLLTTGQKDAGDRVRARDGEASDAIGGRPVSYHESVNRAFLDFAEKEPHRFAIVDGSGTIDEVHRRVMRVVAPLISEVSR